ncbi:MAG: HAD family hydrolase [Candidatus Bathyarchaeia archaeon]
MTIKAVIFDLDGTIVDFNIDFKAARAEVIRLLTQQDLPSSLLSVNESLFVTLKKVEKRMKENGKEEQEFVKLKEKVIAVVERYEAKAARETNLISGILETLKTLMEMKLKIALFTANGEKSTNHILSRFHLRQFFDAIITRESVLAVKPDPVHLEAALKALKVRPEEAIVVGDSVRDIECARRLKVLAMGVATGFSSIEELTRAGADYLASSSTDILSLLQKLNRKN